MKKIALFDAKPYDRIWFDQMKESFDFKIKYYENRLNEDTAVLAKGCDGVIAFVNDEIGKATIETLYENGIHVIAMRCAGYNNIDFKAAFGKIHIVRVPAYSPYAVAEHAMAMLLTLNRKTHRAYIRTKEHNFNISGLEGFDLHGKTVGVIGTGKIGRTFIDVCSGFGVEILAYDPFPVKDPKGFSYVSLDELCRRSDIISLHCPLTKDTKHIINSQTLSLMKDGVYLINTSRGMLVNSEALLDAIKSRKVGGAALDVYEEESDLFFEDFSNEIMEDDTLARLISMPNVLITSHQAFLTNEALENIASTTLENLSAFFSGAPLENEICYQCKENKTCDRCHKKRCF